jgi:hypothetical protein
MFHTCYSLLFIELIATSQRAISAWTQLSSIPEVRALASLMIWSIFLTHWQTSVDLLRHDDNVRRSFKAILDTFQFANEADVLKNIQPASTQANMLNEMLHCVSECAKFIKSYAFFTGPLAKKHVQVGTSSGPLSLLIINM